MTTRCDCIPTIPRHALVFALLLACLPWTAGAQPTASTIQVGPTRSVTTIAAAAKMAAAGSVIAVDAGDYIGDTAVWAQDELTLRAVGGRVRLLARGTTAEGKAIWVVRAKNFSVEGFDFEEAAVDAGNGGGIRLERGSMKVRDCRFVNNDTGILTSNDNEVELDVSNSEFGAIHRIDGQNHNLYVGAIKRLSVTGSYFHHAQIGHLLKTRAAYNYIAYNRLTDEAGGAASYELEFANGGIAFVIGNVIQQGDSTENPNMISYGSEGYRWPDNELYVVNNTFVDDRAKSGVFLRVMPGQPSVKLINNVLIGNGRWDVFTGTDLRGNVVADRSTLIDAGPDAYRPKSMNALRGKAVDAGTARGQSLMPLMEYVHPRQTKPLTAAATAPGAFQSAGRAAR